MSTGFHNLFNSELSRYSPTKHIQLPLDLATLYSNNLTTLLLSILKDGQLHLAEDDAILTGPPEGDPLHVPGMGGVLVCQNGELHPAHASLAKKVSS